MYQYTTHYPLAMSKVYVNNIDNLLKHLKKCVGVTNDYRKKNGQNAITFEEIEMGQKVLKLDMDKNPGVMRFLGAPVKITTKNLEKPKSGEESLWLGEE